MDDYFYTDYDLQALVDNELEYERAKNVRRYVQTDPVAAERYEELLQQKKLLQLWWNDTSKKQTH